MVKVDTVKTDVMSVSLIREGLVAGYFSPGGLHRGFDGSEETGGADRFHHHRRRLFLHLFQPEIDFTKVASLDLEAFKKGMRESINKKLEQELVKDVLIEQIDYLTKGRHPRGCAQAPRGPQKKEEEKAEGRRARRAGSLTRRQS